MVRSSCEPRFALPDRARFTLPQRRYELSFTLPMLMIKFQSSPWTLVFRFRLLLRCASPLRSLGRSRLLTIDQLPECKYFGPRLQKLTTIISKSKSQSSLD